ncbi:MAG: TonB-dependent receptor plug domain-containing protein [Duncaniella sp.]|nr:TonB-dependent receptor plug domain-containing protein [Duncaniella sp.]
MVINRLFPLYLTVLCTAVSYGEEPADTIPSHELSEIVVQGNSARERVNNLRLGAERLELSKLNEIPSFGGEKDIIKSLSMLPGVRAEGEGGGGFEVRGGNASQNLVTLDGISLYNPAHVMGIFSTFNDEALGGATLYKGPLPAMYGEATSSVLETSLSPGDMEHYHGSLTVGILAAKIKAEGPVVKNKMSFAVSARRSYVDMFLNMVPQYRSTIMNFYDVTAKIRFRPSSRHIIDGSFFASRDNMAISHIMGLYWGNIGGSVNWMARPTDKVSFTTTASVTHFSPKMSMDMMNMNQEMLTFIRSYSLNERIRYNFSEHHALETGIRSELYRVKSAEWIISDVREREIRALWANSAWADYTGSFGEKFDVSAGVRLNLSSILSGAGFHEFISVNHFQNQFAEKTYCDVQPRLSLKYNISRLHNLKAGYAVVSQNLHAIRSSATSFPFDRYALTSAHVRPERAEQVGIGYSGMTSDGGFDWSVEGYYKNINNVYDFKDGKGTFSDIVLENIILGGRGRSYGAEFMLRKNYGKLTGWISYTLSNTETKIPDINDGKWYAASNDCRHDFTISGIYRFNDRWNISASWIYLSGKPLTVPDVKYEVAGETCYYYSSRNGYTAPSTHRLDLAAKYTHKGRKFTYEWSFGIYNTYCRYNPYIVYFEDDPEKPSGTRAVQRSLYGLIPSVSYTLKF